MNYMHKILCLLALLPATAASVQAQSAGCIEILDGSARVREIAVSHNDDKLFVSMDIDISQLDLRSNREIVFSPAIESADELLALPAVTIAGRNRYYHHLRNEAADETMQLYRTGQTDIIRYRAVVPYSEWMSLSDLNAESRECGCCNVQLASDKMRLTSIEIAHPAPPVFVPSLVYIRPEAREKIVVAEGSAFIDFPVNRTEIHESYRNNTAELNKILATIDAIRNDADTRILAVTIKGYASPEGPYERNVELSKGRTETLKEYVRRQYSFPDGLLSTDYEPEDWQGLERYVAHSELQNRDAILEIIRGTLAPDAKEWKIKSTYPDDYRFLLDNVYPALRHSDYAVKYEVRAYTDVDQIKRLLSTSPQKLSLEEMYMAAQHMEPGSDEYNETFEIAVRMYPDDPTANLNAANTAMSRGDMKNASRYLAKAGSTPEATYARGMYAAIEGDWHAARMLLESALDMGIESAREALRQIDTIAPADDSRATD